MVGGGGQTPSTGGSGAPVGATYLVVSAHADLTAERIATAGDAVSFTDAGANGNFTISVVSSPAGAATVVGTGRTITAGTGLSGGGDLSANRTVSLSTPVSVANGGTNSTTALNNGRVIISSAGAIVERAALTASALAVGDTTNGVTSLSLGTGNQVVGMNSGATANEYKTVNGTSNQVTVTHAANSVTFSTPQDIHTAATPQFRRLGLNAAASSTTGLLMVAPGTGESSTRFPAGTAPTTPVEGDVWNDSTQKALIAYMDALNQKLSASNFTQTASVTVANTVTETTLTGSGTGTLTYPANFLVVGKNIRVKAWGYLSTNSLAGGTLNIKVKLGSIVVLTTNAYTFGSDLTDELWELEGLITCRTTGASGTVFSQGMWTGDVQAGGLGGSFDYVPMKNTATVTVNTTASQAFDVTATWSVAAAGNSITLTNLVLEVVD